MFAGTTTTVMTAVNPFKKFQTAAHEQKELPSGLQERESATIGGTPLPLRKHSVKKPTPLTSRNRTYTSPSLYTTFEKSLSPEVDSRSRSVSSPENSSFAESFMRTSIRPQQHRQWHSDYHPKTPMDPGCILPGPARTINPFEMASVQASTLAGSPAWWCRHDKLVILDGFRTDEESGARRWITRTSKGLEAARRTCAKERVQVELSCAHCRTMLGRDKWVYAARVCELSVCRECKLRCQAEQEKKDKKRGEELRSRRDSFLTHSPPAVELHLVDNKDLRKVHSEGYLRGMTDRSIDEILHGQAQPESTQLDLPAKEVRRWRSQQQIQT
jgi:hypothetical protein